MFFEKNAQEAIEKFVPDQTDVTEVKRGGAANGGVISHFCSWKSY